MALVRDGVAVEDDFAALADDMALPEAGGVIVSLARFQSERDALLASNRPLGVRLASDQSPEQLGDDVHRLSVVALEFPAFRDGRAFSHARILRTRMAYKGEIRAVGHFLRDQILFMARVGVNAFDLPAVLSPADVAEAMAELSLVYQPSVDGKPTIRDLRKKRTT